MSIVSNGDGWLFAGSNGSFTAGRKDPDHAMFPYRTADKILNQPGGGGARSFFHVQAADKQALWKPWQNAETSDCITRNLYKSVLGTSVIFEEINEHLGLRFCWTLTTSETFGLVRFCALENVGRDTTQVRYLDGWYQIIPPGISQDRYDKYSYLAAAYMRHECLDGLGIYTLNSGITDRAEPCESLRAAAAWSLGHSNPTMLLSERQVETFRRGQSVTGELEVRGEFGAFLVCDSVDLMPGESHDWVTVADTGLDHSALVKLRNQLAAPKALKKLLQVDVASTRDGLKRRIAAADGLQHTADQAVCVHHFANVLFNCMRGGTLPESYRLPKADYAAFLRSRNSTIHARHAAWLEQLPAQLELETLRQRAAETTDPQLLRLTREYLPLTFSRRHGDPSRPWNRFSIRTRDEDDNTIHDYQGNWRDIFQNWESLAQSYPACLESMVSIFLNASTADGYNPYRITRATIDWEVEDPHDPWSQIGYWGDHQIIYLLRLLESYERVRPGKLSQNLNERLFGCAKVPYKIKGFDELVRDPRHSIRFDSSLHEQLLARAKEIGNDGKLHVDKSGQVLLFSLAEKLLVPLLAKLSNFVPGGGIWLNTQRPEWNDANNALAGWGLSVVTLCYLLRYLRFLDQLFANTDKSVELSTAAATFARQVSDIFAQAECTDAAARYDMVVALGKAGEQHRQAVYHGGLDQRASVPVAEVRHLITAAFQVVNAALRANRRADGMFHSYNLLKISQRKATVYNLDLMLEGQVAVLSSGLLGPAEALSLLRSLRHSDLFRADQHSYLLYPDSEIPSFLSRNTLPADWAHKVPSIAPLAANGDRHVIVVDENGAAHFQGDLINSASLDSRLNQLATDVHWARPVEQDRPALLELWETVFQHCAYTGRSGTMFAFEGLGSIYWHMIAKLLVAVEECHRQAVESDAPVEIVAGLHAAYYDIRSGLGFTKTPEVYGAFPTDPYSHTPRHLGAQQPGMTGQVKEEILTRWAELGVRVNAGVLRFEPKLLRRVEFFDDPHEFTYLDADGLWQTWKLPAETLAFTYCQVPICYRLSDAPSITVERQRGDKKTIVGQTLSPADSKEVFSRNGEITRLMVEVPRSNLCDS
jgi:hypothetical protein